MNFRQLEAFHSVLMTGSVTRAAERLNISQPAVSKLLKAMTDQCGFPLFTRNASGMVPTKEGMLLAAEVNRLFSGTERIERVAEAVRDDGLGMVSVIAMPALASRFLPTILARGLHDRHNLRLTLRAEPSPRIGESVASQQADIGLSILPFDHAEIRSEVVLRYDMVCIMPAENPLASKQVVSVTDLRNEQFISLARDDCALMTIDRAFQIAGVQKKSWLEVPSSEAACALIANGAGLSVLPSFVGLDYPQSRLVRRSLDPLISVDLWMLTSSAVPPTRAAEHVAEHLRQSFAAFTTR